jgi:acyl-CoA thioester hydrolase
LAAKVTSTGGFLNLDTRKLVIPPTKLLTIYQAMPRTDGFEPMPSGLKPKAA